MATQPNYKIPRGWERVTTGRVQKGDKCYRLARKGWGFAAIFPQFMGDKASEFVFVIRRKPAPKPAAKEAAWNKDGLYRAGRGWLAYLNQGDDDGNIRIVAPTRAAARRLRDMVLAALNGGE